VTGEISSEKKIANDVMGREDIMVFVGAMRDS
jgi:hypothetical protein